MGIRPNKSGDIIVNPPDNSQSRWGDWVTGLEGAGDTAGGVVSEIDAKAESANTGSGELAGDLTALEGRVGSLEESIPGTSAPAPLTIMRRNYAGQAQIEDPASALDIANKRYVDNYTRGASASGFSANARKPVFLDEVGKLTVSAGSVSRDQDVVPKVYVDSMVSGYESRIADLEARLDAADIPPAP